MAEPTQPHKPHQQSRTRPFIRGGRLIAPPPRPPRTGGGHPQHGRFTSGHRPLHTGAPRPQGLGHGGGKHRGGRGRGNAHRGGGRGNFRKGGNPRGGNHFARVKQTIKHSQDKQAELLRIPPIAPDTVRIIPLGGVEEVGRNMTVFETEKDILIVDIGVQFSEDDTPGVDFILPNTRYLEDKKEKIRGVVITHGHLDHIGGIPYILDGLGNPPIFTRHFTALMIKKRQEEFPGKPTLDIREIETNDTIQVGDLVLRFFGVTHAIPDSMAVAINTPWGEIVHTGDLRLQHVDGTPTADEFEHWKRFDQPERKILALLTDSTNCENPGFSLPEARVMDTIEGIIKTTLGRLVIATFSSQVDRMIAMITMAEKYGKKVFVDGRSMKNNLELIRLDGRLKVKDDTIVPIEDVGNYPESKVVAIVTGAQGEEFAALMRIANKTHKHIRLSPRDTVLMSSSIIPGNERGVQKLKDNLSRQGARIIHNKIADVHSSGHANSGELEWIHKKVKEKFFIPLHGYHYLLRQHGDIAISTGVAPENVVVPDNGMIIEIVGGEKIVVREEKAPSGLILVDGFNVGEIQEVVLRDRQMLAEDGVFVIYGIVDMRTRKMIKSPDIISRGFVYLRESQELLSQARLLAKKIIEKESAGMAQIDFDAVREAVRDAIEKFLFQETHKQPIVISVVFGI